jgi:hypothetical protein
MTIGPPPGLMSNGGKCRRRADAWTVATILPRFGRSRGMTHPRRGQSLVGKPGRSRAVGEAMDGVAVVEEAGEVGLRQLEAGAGAAAVVAAPAGVAVE